MSKIAHVRGPIALARRTSVQNFSRRSGRLSRLHDVAGEYAKGQAYQSSLEEPRIRSLAVKDNICTVEKPTTCASNVLLDFHSPFDATVVESLRHAGVEVDMKSNLDEFGMGQA